MSGTGGVARARLAVERKNWRKVSIDSVLVFDLPLYSIM